MVPLSEERMPDQTPGMADANSKIFVELPQSVPPRQMTEVDALVSMPSACAGGRPCRHSADKQGCGNQESQEDAIPAGPVSIIDSRQGHGPGEGPAYLRIARLTVATSAPGALADPLRKSLSTQ